MKGETSMEFLSYIILFILFIYVLDTNTKVKTFYHKIHLEDDHEKEHIFRMLKGYIAQTIQIRIKESYSEFGQVDEPTFDTVGENRVKVLALNKDWVHIELYGKQTVQKLIRLESIASIDTG